MALDATSIYAVVSELNKKLTGGKIEKVFQGEKYQITLLIRANRNNYRLLLSASSSYPRIHISQCATLNPEIPPMFCMLLRKRLVAGKIISISQIDMERIVKIEISARDELGRESTYYLYCEMMGRHSNIIMVDGDNKIVESVKRVDVDKSRIRQVLPGIDYTLPPSQDKRNPKDLSLDDFNKILLNNIDNTIASALQNNILGLSKKTLIYLFDDMIDISTPLTRLDNDEVLKLAQRMHEFYTALFNDTASFYGLYDSANNIHDFTILFITPSMEHIKYDSINSLIDDFYRLRALRDNISKRTSALRQSVKIQLERGIRKLRIQQNILADQKSLDKYRLYGELLTSFSYLVPKGASEVELQNFYSETGETVLVPLDPKRNVSSNAARYFKKYKKLKTAIDLAHGQSKETSAEIEYLDGILHLLDNCDSEDLAIEIQNELIDGGYIKKSRKKVSRKLPPSKPYHFLSSDGHDIYIGRNNKQNDELTMRFARGDDIWLHTKDIPGSHVIIRTKNNTVSDKAILDGAFFAAWFSKARNSSNVPVDFTKRRNIRKPNGSKPGYVIFLSNSTINVTCTKEKFSSYERLD